MQTYRISACAPRMAAPARRSMACYAPYTRIARRAPTSFFPGFPANDFAPFFRMFDEMESLISQPSQPIRTFQPRFDVREEKDAFHLMGELPGIDQQDLQIEFVDQNTLIVRGRSVRESSSKATPAPIESAQPQPSIEDKGKGKEIEATAEPSTEARAVSPASSYRKPSVEDDFVDVASDTDAGATPTTATEAQTSAEVAQASTPAAQESAQQAEGQQDSSRYWVSERSVGEFHRTFRFPGHVDQEAVTASLKNGILSVVVPKAVVKQPRKITVE